MKKLDLDVPAEHPDEASFDEFNMAFRSPLDSATKRAMGMLLHGRPEQLGAAPEEA